MQFVSGQGRAGIVWRRLAAACLIVSAVAMPVPAPAQPVTPPPTTAPTTAPGAPPAPPADNASLSHSALKASTYKVFTTVSGLTLYTYGTSSIVGGIGLVVFNSVQGWLAYTGTDYLFDTYWPKQATTTDRFDVADSAERNTWKFLLFESIITPVKFLSLYVATGSATTMVAIGTASLLVNSTTFYINNVMWDWIDWTRETSPAAPAARPG